MCSIANLKWVLPDKICSVPSRSGISHGLAEGSRLHSQSDLFFIDDLDNLVLARLALKSALLRTGPIRFYSGEPHRRAALGASWMCDVLCMRNGLKLAHGVTPLPLQAGGPA